MLEVLANHPVFGAWQDDWSIVEADEDIELDSTLSLNGRLVPFILNIENDSLGTLTPAGIDELSAFVTQLSRFDEVIRTTVRVEAEIAGSVVSDYIDHHQEEGVCTELTQSEFAQKIYLDKVYLYCQTWHENGACFDYRIDQDKTDYVLAVTLNRAGTIDSIEMES